MTLGCTPSQTVGPYFSIGLPFEMGRFVVPAGTRGAILITGTVFDGDGSPVADSLIETWQADPDGRFADMHGYGDGSRLSGFRGFARVGVEDDDLRFALLTVKPGRVPWVGGVGDVMQAPHIDVSVFARGLLDRCVTRIYFADEEEANAIDPVLRGVPAGRRETLLAEQTADGYRFDIRLQGEGETVFFDV